MVDDLARGEHGRDHLRAVQDGVEAHLEDADQVLAGVTLGADGLLVIFLELLLADVAVIALELLLGHQLHTEVGRLLAALAVLARTVFAAVQGRFRTAPQVHTQATVDLVLGGMPLVVRLCHIWLLYMSEGAPHGAACRGPVGSGGTAGPASHPAGAIHVPGNGGKLGISGSCVNRISCGHAAWSAPVSPREGC